ncbi:transposase [Sorangium sp. So ce726]|uniref:transposase n=1 Tax=Sorangium sp. So ce726 TaxID=3133319 RepID=UPI003F5E5670
MSRSPRWECANDPSRRREAQIPDGIQFKSKVDLALDAIERAAADNVPGQLVLADAVYGRSAKFRDTVRLLGFDYPAVAAHRVAVRRKRSLEVRGHDAGDQDVQEADRTPVQGALPN